MALSSNRWTVISPSEYQWERDALEYIRESLPDNESYRAWSNFEFISDDGSINEVDLLIATPCGLFLIEIKSRPASTNDILETISVLQKTPIESWTGIEMEDYLEGLKFSVCLPPTLAAAMVACRLHDITAIESLLSTLPTPRSQS